GAAMPVFRPRPRGAGRGVSTHPADYGSAIALALDRAPADVVAVELSRPGDAGHFGIGAIARFGDRVAQRAHAQHAAAGGDDAVAVQARAGVEDLGVVHVGHVPGVDHVAGARRAGIAL